MKYQTSSSNDVSSDDKYGCDARYRNHHQDTDVDMDEESEDEDGGNGGGRVGWGNEHTEWWLEYMREKGGRGVSKDTWQMVRRVCVAPFHVLRPVLWIACRFHPVGRCQV